MVNRCKVHTDKNAVNKCQKCDCYLCENCWKIFRNLIVCSECREKLLRKNIIHKGCTVFVLLFLLVPLTIKYRLKIGLFIAGRSINEEVKVNNKEKEKAYERNFLKGKALKLTGKLPAAIEAFKNCTKLFPKRLESRQELGECYLSMNMLSRAEKEFSQIVKVNKKDRKAVIPLSKILWDSEKKEEAIELLENAQSDDNKEKLLNLISEYIAGDKKYFDKAIEVFTQLIYLDPNNDKAYYNRGIIHFRKKAWSTAIADFEKAIELDNTYTKPRAFLAKCYFKSGNCIKAFKSLEALKEIYPIRAWSEDLQKSYKKYKNCAKKLERKSSA